MIFKYIFFTLISFNFLSIEGNNYTQCNELLNNKWIFCSKFNNGECFDTNKNCFENINKICKKKWKQLEKIQYEGLVGTCKRKRKKCKVKTCSPTKVPNVIPTKSPTKVPIVIPTKSPTKVPIVIPTKSPTKVPIVIPTKSPSKAPIVIPTEPPPNVERYELFTLLFVPLLILCISKPNVLVRWWRVLTCWSRRHPNEVDRTEASPEDD